MKILIADDDAVSRLLLEEVLSEMGHEVISVGDGDRAWEALSTDPDLRMVLLDWMMPGKTGIEVAQEVKKHFHRNERYVYVIMVSQRDSTVDLVEAMDAGADDYIPKPVDVSELKVRIISGIRLLDFHNRLRAAGIRQEEINEELRTAHDELEDRVERRTAELAEANRRLRLSEETFRAIFESAEDWMFVKDAKGRFTHVNPALLKSLGLDHKQVIGKTQKKISEPDEAEALGEVDSRVLAGHTVKHQYTTVVEGRPIVAEFVRAPLRDAAENVIGLCGIGRDVTDRVRQLSHPDIRTTGPLSERYTSLAIRRTLDQIELAAASNSIVLLLGESGVGKDFLARLIHERSRRAKGPFTAVNCAALPSELAEAELFGYEAGAFTGATGRTRGFLELAEGGTLLLNEVGELTLPMQAKLLTFLDSRAFTRVGGRSPIVVNAKILAATNRDLKEEVDEGRFRKDLLYRLDVFTVHVPPLRDRIEDLPVLVEDILEDMARSLGLPQAPGVYDSVMAQLAQYDWPGNIRELRNILERALILSKGGKIGPDHIDVLAAERKHPEETGVQLAAHACESLILDEAITNLRQSFVTEALRRSGNNVKRAAEFLGIGRNTLYEYMRTFGLRD